MMNLGIFHVDRHHGGPSSLETSIAFDSTEQHTSSSSSFGPSFRVYSDYCPNSQITPQLCDGQCRHEQLLGRVAYYEREILARFRCLWRRCFVCFVCF